MDSYLQSIDLSIAEIYAAASLLGGSLVVGVRDPFSDPLLDREQVLDAGLESLAERNLVAVGSLEDTEKSAGDEYAEEVEAIGIEPTLAFMIRVLTEPDATFMLSRVNEASGEALDVTFHLQDVRALMLVPAGEDRYTLTPLDTAIDIQDLIMAIWDFVGMDETAFAGVLDESADARVRGHVIAFRQAGDELSSRSLAVYRDAGGLWCATPSSRGDALAFQPVDEVDLAELLDDLMTLTVHPNANIERSAV